MGEQYTHRGFAPERRGTSPTLPTRMSVDASAMLEFLLQTPLGARVEARLFRDEEEFHSPHLMDVEVTQGLWRLVRSGEVSATRAAEAIEDLSATSISTATPISTS